ncbi:unnamed protein product [Ectocarpus sp. CCAP 1310/34]|nr:unnamed protein product [Ectocarpus sp. CCAP 1310/34]
MSESGADPAGHFDSFESVVRAHGRSETASWLLVTLFCDVFGMDRSVYIYFPRGRNEDNGWDRTRHQSDEPSSKTRGKKPITRNTKAAQTICSRR